MPCHGIPFAKCAWRETSRTAAAREVPQEGVGSLGHLSPSHVTQMCDPPRSMLPEVLESMRRSPEV